ncbi:division plane positioning ATPase MipZ [Caballeronia mineralivorans]|uniref:division plane positioning ATPase MipZ n=1 Tax=Caballeronia mineralivorans TaxID=2010198 RepID=UPI0023F101CC|nr:division plane positioning ATPase MipZ [Caballeronia mineralivorans]MDB5781684.1 cobyrinic acid a,c-diamide synthase [Caballeronia mineralivorans]
MILLVAAEKGGVGKSTLATNLAVHLAHQGVDVVLLDTDGQATAAQFVERRDEAGITPAVPCVQRTGEVASTLRDLARRYQVVVVDAGGRDSREMRSAMAVASLVLVPTKASQADLETLPKVNELIGLARALNPELKAVAILSIAPSNPVIREVEDARKLLAEFDQLELADTIIRDRKVYRDALLAGKGVTELDNSQARAEIQLLAQEFFDLS